ncbi:hypothetical protein GYB22_11190 [bacterium]|nr:hypothetical protein [bacterium]
MKKVVFIHLLLVVFSNCKEKNEPCSCNELQDVEHNLLEYAYLDTQSVTVGDQFVFKFSEDQTQYDTLTVTSFFYRKNGCEFTDLQDIGFSNCSNFYEVRMDHSNSNHFPSFGTQLSAGNYRFICGRVSEYSVLLLTSEVKSEGSTGHPLIVSPGVSPDGFVDQSSSSVSNYLARRLDSITVEGKIYNDVILSYLRKNPSNDPMPDSLYFAPEIGLIRYKNVRNEIWNLVNK